MATKKLYKSTTDRKVSGVCAGIANYFDIDPTLVRLVWLLFVFSGAGIIAYIISAVIIPDEPFIAENSYADTNRDNGNYN